jgi:tripeptide aminopeptidase
MTAAAEPDAGRLFSIFSELIKLSSESGHEASVCAFIKDFCANIGAVCHEDNAGRRTGGECGNLVVRVPAGTFSPLPPIIFNAHMDTVRPGRGIMPIDAGDRFMSGGMTVLGADDKAGVAAILASIEMMSKTGAKNRALELVFTVQEEPGLIGAKNLDTSLLDGTWGLVLDGSGPVGGVITRAPGRDLMRFTMRGRAAHAGIEPEKGRNALYCMCEAVTACGSGRIDDSTTLNFGLIAGGVASNIVAEEATVEGEARSLSVERLAGLTDRVIATFRVKAAARECELSEYVERSFEPFSIDETSTPVKLLTRAMKECKVEPRFEASGGGSDANILNRAGFTMLNIGIGLADAHSKQESILKKDLIDTTRVISRLAMVAMDEESA